MSYKLKLIVGLLIALLSSFLVASNLLFENRQALPLIQGVVIPEGKPIAPFQLRDHHNQPFSNQQLLGQWHLISYGYTSCPDICPNILTVLNQVSQSLEKDVKERQLKMVFYTIDPMRDTVSQLNQYLDFFNPRFIGLTLDAESISQSLLAQSQNSIVPSPQSSSSFEKSLGMRSQLTPVENAAENKIYGDYQVSHGVMLYLINPKGKLQAVIKPEQRSNGAMFFSAEQIYQDYLAIRDYFG